MIVKPYKEKILPADPRLIAGANAERQMAFYLHRAFVDSIEIHVLNDLRLVDPQQPEFNGQAGVCQIDHLVIHRWGVFIIESKSASDEVAVRDDGVGGDEWTRKFRGSLHGIPSPIQQARRQGEFLRRFLRPHNGELLGKVPVGLRTVVKAFTGTDQRRLSSAFPVQLIVALSDGAVIRRINRWKEPSKPFQTFVSKADLVAGKIQEEHAKHRSALWSRNVQGNYGLWSMKPEEAIAVARFLADNHEPQSEEPPAAPLQARTESPSAPNVSPRPGRRTTQGERSTVHTGPHSVVPAASSGVPSCKVCGGVKLVAMLGKYGHYWKCNECGGNTAMPLVCSICGAAGRNSNDVRIRQDGNEYFRFCIRCKIEERVWRQ